jgi:hypothetical protein
LAVPNVVPRLTDTPGGVDTLGPSLDQHNAEVYGRLLGMTAADCRARADRSVPLRDVNFLQKLSSGIQATDVRDDLGYELGHGWPPRHVRHNRNLGMKPKRAFWRQWLGPQGVQCGV